VLNVGFHVLCSPLLDLAQTLRINGRSSGWRLDRAATIVAQ
jgi:hypothetical protein